MRDKYQFDWKSNNPLNPLSSASSALSAVFYFKPLEAIKISVVEYYLTWVRVIAKSLIVSLIENSIYKRNYVVWAINHLPKLEFNSLTRTDVT